MPEIEIAEVMIKLEEEKLKEEPLNTELVELGGHNNQLEKAMTKNSISNVEVIDMQDTFVYYFIDTPIPPFPLQEFYCNWKKYILNLV